MHAEQTQNTVTFFWSMWVLVANWATGVGWLKSSSDLLLQTSSDRCLTTSADRCLKSSADMWLKSSADRWLKTSSRGR